jgi:serine/threonine-protein kinase
LFDNGAPRSVMAPLVPTSTLATAALRRGVLLHKYRIEKRLGEGRFTTVYRALDTIEGVRVALKVFANHAAAHNLFAHEARIAALLEHPNIVRLKTAEAIGGQRLLVTELGHRSLADALERPRSVRFALHVLIQVLRGLAYAHERGIIHRDIKPENILLWRDGRVKVGDFGVSRFAEPATHTTVSGTPSYRAPEQAYGRPEFASDVFSAALVFYEMVTNVLPAWPFRWPFERHERFVSHVPPSLVQVIRRAAGFDLARRPRDARAFLVAVRQAVPGLGAVRSPSPNGRRLTWREYRQREFEQRFGRRLALDYRCNRCSGSISEFMLACPWCGYGGNSFFGIGTFPDVCAECERGVHNDWRFCPWCYGAGFRSVSRLASHDPRYGGRCPNPRCRETRLLPHMRHCPWCNARLRPWRSRMLAGRCPGCKASVSAEYWDICPWCGRDLHAKRVTHGRRGA